MDRNLEHRIAVKIADADAFKLTVNESEESFYRHVIEQINANWKRLHYGAGADTSSAALAKVALYYATMLYRQTNMINSQAEILQQFEDRIDKLLEGSD